MAADQNMPLQSELGLVNYLQGLFSGKVANPNYTGASVPAPVTAPLMSGQDMQNIMTEFLRGNGQFLDHMRQQNLSGLYNSSTQKLVANDLTAQAALKASTANSAIQQQNASILNNYNARVALQQPQYLPNTQGGLGKTSAALGIAGLDKLLGGVLGGGSGNKKGKSTKKDDTSGESEGKGIFEAISSAWENLTSEGGGIPKSAETYGFDPFADPKFNASDYSNYATDVDPMAAAAGLGNFGLNFEFNTDNMVYNPSPSIDTYETFQDSYGSAPGYDFQDYDEYFFD